MPVPRVFRFFLVIRLLLLLVVLTLAALAGGWFLPSQVVVERSFTVNRPASTVFTVLNGFRTWEAWSPWIALDPGVRLTRDGPATGVGARLSWSGDPTLVGTGQQVITASEPYSRVVLQATVNGQAEALLSYRVDDGGLGSAVHWRFEADLVGDRSLLGGLVGRYFGLFLKRWVAADFEQGQARFKAFVERLPEWDFAGAPIERVEREARPMVSVPGIAADTPEAVAQALAIAFAELATLSVTQGVDVEDAPLTITELSPDGTGVFEAALLLRPVTDGETAAVVPAVSGRVRQGVAPSGPAACISHRGAIEDTMSSYEQLAAWMAAHGYRESGVSTERYHSGPAETGVRADLCQFIAVDAETPAARAE